MALTKQVDDETIKTLQLNRAHLLVETGTVLASLIKASPKAGGHAANVQSVTIVIEGGPRPRRPRREYNDE